jgi:hypothetical protein
MRRTLVVLGHAALWVNFLHCATLNYRRFLPPRTAPDWGHAILLVAFGVISGRWIVTRGVPLWRRLPIPMIPRVVFTLLFAAVFVVIVRNTNYFPFLGVTMHSLPPAYPFKNGEWERHALALPTADGAYELVSVNRLGDPFYSGPVRVDWRTARLLMVFLNRTEAQAILTRKFTMAGYPPPLIVRVRLDPATGRVLHAEPAADPNSFRN